MLLIRFVRELRRRRVFRMAAFTVSTMTQPVLEEQSAPARALENLNPETTEEYFVAGVPLVPFPKR